ncbi:caveolin-2 isoform X2 [Salminus brasiliensis]|uniref:caveolin-2 isoform X2 n=1 Tax=Salminus brasiliensis TaxID=930266 RepID=UPI003B831FD4
MGLSLVFNHLYSVEPHFLRHDWLKVPNCFRRSQSSRRRRGLSQFYWVEFEDIIAEPSSTHSFDSVWIWSHAVFELLKYVLYRLLTTLLAIPMAFVAGIVFGLLSCVHIWIVMPLVHSCMMALPSIQVVWASLMDMFVGPFFHSIGKSLSSINVKTVQN